jgi:hypothetical protein
MPSKIPAICTGIFVGVLTIAYLLLTLRGDEVAIAWTICLFQVSGTVTRNRAGIARKERKKS